MQVPPRILHIDLMMHRPRDPPGMVGLFFVRLYSCRPAVELMAVLVMLDMDPSYWGMILSGGTIAILQTLMLVTSSLLAADSAPGAVSE